MPAIDTRTNTSRAVYVPRLYIGVGETHAFYTLRETYLHERISDGRLIKEERSFHHFNLSQDAAEAVEKAQEASKRFGLPVSGQTAASIACEMRDIQRATAEEITQREQARLDREAEWEAQRAAELQLKLHILSEGRFVHGEYSGRNFDCAPRSLLQWLVTKLPEFEEGSVMRATAEAVQARCAALMLPQPDVAKIVGTPGKRVAFQATVVRSHSYDSDYGRVYITTMVTPERECLVVFSGAFGPQVGDVVEGKATVKEHKEFRGQWQTIVQRVAAKPVGLTEEERLSAAQEAWHQERIKREMAVDAIAEFLWSLGTA